MLESFDGKKPRVADTAFVHPSAHVRGDVEIGEYSIVWPGTTIAGDIGTIKIGRCVIIEDNCALHAGACDDWENNRRSVMEISPNVTIGHGAVIHARKIGAFTMIGMNATVLERVEIGDHCIVAAGALVPEGIIVPDASMVAGIPAKIKTNVQKDKSVWLLEPADVDDTYYIEHIRKWKQSITQDRKTEFE